MYPSRLSALRLGLSLVTLLALAGCDGGDAGLDDTGDPSDCDSGETGETGAPVDTTCADFAISASATSIIAGESVEVTVTGSSGATAIRIFRGSSSDGDLATGDGETLTATFAPTLADPFTLVAMNGDGCTASVDVLVSPGPAEALYSEVGAQEYDGASGELVRYGTVRVLDAYGNPLPVTAAEFDLEAIPRGMSVDTAESTEDSLVLRASVTDEWVTGKVVVRYGEWSSSLDMGLVPQEIRVGEPGGGQDLPGVQEGESAFFFPTLYVPGGEEPVYGWTTSFVVTGVAADDVYVSERPSESRGCTWEWGVEDLGGDGAAVTVSGLCETPFEAGMHQPIEVEIVNVVAEQVIEVRDLVVDLAGAAWEWASGLLREAEQVTIRGKALTKLCVSFWYIGNTTQANIALDLQNAQRILHANSQRCTCPRFYQIDPTLHPLSDEEYLSLINLEEPSTWFSDPEMRSIASGHELRDSSCINVYYGRIEPDDRGRSYGRKGASPTSGAVFVNSESGRGITLAHELVHKGSGNTVLDSPYDNGPVPQGANEPGNLFNYANEGEDITATQCGLFDANLP